MLVDGHEAVLDDGDHDGEDAEGDARVPGRGRDGQRGAGDGNGDGAPGADIRGGEAAEARDGEVVDARVGGREEDVHADGHEDRDDGAAQLRVELHPRAGAQQVRRLEVAEHVGGLLGRAEREHAACEVEHLRVLGRVFAAGDAADDELRRVADAGPSWSVNKIQL